MPYTQVYGIVFIVSTKTDSFASLLHGHKTQIESRQDVQMSRPRSRVRFWNSLKVSILKKNYLDLKNIFHFSLGVKGAF